jgi:hypothetical protein
MELKINESKVLEFNTVIEGGNADDLSAKLRVTIDEMEYGFPVKVDGKKIQVKIPPLKDYIKEGKLRGKKATARLDIVAKGKIFTPWKDNLEIEIPLEVKAEMTDIKGFLEEADSIIKVSKIDERRPDGKTKDEGKTKTEGGTLDEKKSKIKSKFSIMLEEKCPEGQKF